MHVRLTFPQFVRNSFRSLPFSKRREVTVGKIKVFREKMARVYVPTCTYVRGVYDSQVGGNCVCIDGTPETERTRAVCISRKEARANSKDTVCSFRRYDA